MENKAYAIAAMILVFIIAFLAIEYATRQGPEQARNALEAQGMTDVRLLGWAYIGCPGDNHYQQRFSGKNVNGLPVEGTICCRMLEGCVTRY